MNEPMPLRVANGFVIDPANERVERANVLLAGGCVVEAFSADEAASARTIDATGQCIMPGAIDMHSHIASRGVTLATSLEAQHDVPPILAPPRDLALAYARQGYTTVIDAAVPPDEADYAHRQIEAMVNIDAGFLLEIGSDDALLRALAEEGEPAALEHLGQLLEQSNALGLKAVNPGLVDDLDARVGDTRVTPRDLLQLAARAVAKYDLKHPLHVHAPRLGEPGNVDQTLAVLEALSDHYVHVAHGQFSTYGETNNGGFVSGVEALLDYFHDHARLTMDAGCVSFGPAWMVSRDHRLAERLAKAMHQPLMQQDGWSVMAMQYGEEQPVNALQWAIGLELILRCTDLSRLALSVDFPNGGSFQAMPQLMRLLASSAQRQQMLDRIHPWARERTTLGGLSRELTDEQLVTVTRHAPAKALGLSSKGHLGPGAAGDVVIADRASERPGTVIKDGRVVFEHSQWQAFAPGRRLDRHSA
jgi:formylmethanofuran dehydrogenase subunit A